MYNTIPYKFFIKYNYQESLRTDFSKNSINMPMAVKDLYPK